MILRRILVTAAIAACVLGTTGCSTMYYALQEKLGNEKREILTARVEKGAKAQEAAKEQFQTAFEKFQQMAAAPETELSRKYSKLSAEFDDCETRAKAVGERIASIEDVGNAMFREWEGELNQYRDAGLRAASERTLRDSRARFDRLLVTMRNAESRMEPVLGAFRDQVLFLKHNLNAQAVATMEGQLPQVESDVAALMKQMEASIEEAREFVEGMKKS